MGVEAACVSPVVSVSCSSAHTFQRRITIGLFIIAVPLVQIKGSYFRVRGIVWLRLDGLIIQAEALFDVTYVGKEGDLTVT